MQKRRKNDLQVPDPMPRGAELFAQLEAGSTLLTIPEVAQRLKLRPRAVRERIARGELKAVRVGSGQRDRRVTVRDLAVYI